MKVLEPQILSVEICMHSMVTVPKKSCNFLLIPSIFWSLVLVCLIGAPQGNPGSARVMYVIKINPNAKKFYLSSRVAKVMHSYLSAGLSIGGAYVTTT